MKPVFLTWAALALSLGACSTMDMFTYEDANIYAELETNDPTRVTLTITNRGLEELTLNQREAFHISNSRESPLVPVNAAPPGDPPLRVAPGTQQSQSFAPAQAISQTGGKQYIADWVPPGAPADTVGDRFRFAYRLSGRDYPLAFPDPRERPLKGKVKVSLNIALPFRYSLIERRRRIYDQALIQAESAFGGGGRKLRLVNVRYDSSSNGFSEQAVLSADVVELE
ncbi:MAG: hypothetical protein LBQ46_04510 [Treponema sp.]|jgi:hypothetical protein|nr:hypothetical protein [Treponema sp.]